MKSGRLLTTGQEVHDFLRQEGAVGRGGVRVDTVAPAVLALQRLVVTVLATVEGNRGLPGLQPLPHPPGAS